MSDINILYCFDNKFWKQAAVSMCSVLQNKKPDTCVNVYCMVPVGTSWRAKRTLKKLASKYANCRLIWRPIRDNENPFLGKYFARWSPVIFYRLFAHRIFPDMDRILYLDSDTLIVGDLAEMYDTDLGDNILGAVVDCALVDDYNNYMGQYVREFQEKFNPDGYYVNSGVLLMDLTQTALWDALPGFTDMSGFSCPDQDLINMAFTGKMTYLSMRYNFTYASAVSSKYDQQDFINAHKNYVIYHFYTRKPHVLAPEHWALARAYKNVCAAMGWTMDDMLRHEQRYSNHRTNIRGISVRNDGIYCFGIPFR